MSPPRRPHPGPDVVRVVNRTPAPVIVHEPHSHEMVFSLAPLETRVVPTVDLVALAPAISRWETRRILATSTGHAADRAPARTETGPGDGLRWGLAVIGILAPAAFLAATFGAQLQSASFLARAVVLLVFVSLASLLPAAMYLQFDRQRLSGLACRWLFDIFRLDRTLMTLDDVKARYGSLVGDYYGGILEGDHHVRPTNARIRTPVAVATACVTLGWLLVLGPALGSVDPRPCQGSAGCGSS